MRFFFPDSQDQIYPGFDFSTERHPPHRVRQRDDHYAHEALCITPYDGILVSKPIVDGTGGLAGKYSLAQRHRLYRLGVHRFFRLPTRSWRLVAMGDCGAFGYVRDDVPPYTVSEVIDFYDGCGFDLGVSLDHVILGYRPDDSPLEDPALLAEWRRRQDLTLTYADAFLAQHRARRCRFEPIGAVQAWSPGSYADAVEQLQRMGYTRLALGGMVPLKTPDILTCLQAIDTVRRPGVQLHLLGVTRVDHVERFARHGVTSFDSTTPFRQAFMDATDNYWTLDGAHVAVRVPQVDGNAKLKRRIQAGEVQQTAALEAERACLRALVAYGERRADLDEVLQRVSAYALLLGEKDRTEEYRQTLQARPWETCPCRICADAGIQVVVFRGAERNKRRGMHNLQVFRSRLNHWLVPGVSHTTGAGRLSHATSGGATDNTAHRTSMPEFAADG